MMKESLHALHPSDVRCFLEGHGLLDRIEAGGIKCIVCGDILTIESFGAVTRRQNELTFACRKPACLVGLMDAVSDQATADPKRPETAALSGSGRR